MVILYPKNMKNRNTDIDFCRGIAIIMMVIYHWYCIYDIKYNTSYTKKPYIDILGHFSRTVFIFLMGFSISLSHKKKYDDFMKRQAIRASYLVLYAIIITIITRIILKERYVRFGILHYMSIAMLFIAYLANYPNLVLLCGLILYMTYILINNKRSDNIFQSIIGYRPNFNTIDIFPISKWMLLSCIGYYVGSELVDHKKFNENSIIPKNIVTNSITSIGKYSLEIYLIHWVVIYYIQKIFFKK